MGLASYEIDLSPAKSRQAGRGAKPSPPWALTCLKEVAKKYIVESFDTSGQSSVSSAVLFDVYAPGSGQGKNRVEARLGQKPRHILAAAGCTTYCDIRSTFVTNLVGSHIKQAF